jgi:hypothetical protein
VVFVGGADEPVERDVELLVESLEHIGVAPRELLGRKTLCGGCIGHFLTVLVGAGQEADVEAVEALEPGNRVGRDFLVGVSDVWCAVRVVDRGGDVVRLAHQVFHLIVSG